jgi:hypothetical protein
VFGPRKLSLGRFLIADIVTFQTNRCSSIVLSFLASRTCHVYEAPRAGIVYSQWMPT